MPSKAATESAASETANLRVRIQELAALMLPYLQSRSRRSRRLWKSLRRASSELPVDWLESVRRPPLPLLHQRNCPAMDARRRRPKERSRNHPLHVESHRRPQSSRDHLPKDLSRRWKHHPLAPPRDVLESIFSFRPLASGYS